MFLQRKKGKYLQACTKEIPLNHVFRLKHLDTRYVDTANDLDAKTTKTVVRSHCQLFPVL